MRRVLMAAFGIALLAGACGDSDSDSAEPEATEAVAAPTTAAAPDETQAPATTEAMSEDAVAVSLVEWVVDAPTELAAGTVELAISNDGEFPHQFTVIRAESYDALPKNELGTVLIDELEEGQVVVGAVEPFDAGTSQSLTVDLEAGNYVFLCNIEFGPNSHAGNGQTLDVSVS